MEKVLWKGRVVDCVVELRRKQAVKLVLNLSLQLLTEFVICTQLEWFGTDEVRQQVLITYQAVHFIADCTALCPTQVFVGVEV